MPRYFFHVRDWRCRPDDEGTVLPNLAAARTQAAQFAGQVLLEEPDGMWTDTDWQLDVADEAGLVLFSLFFFTVAAQAANDTVTAPSYRISN